MAILMPPDYRLLRDPGLLRSKRQPKASIALDPQHEFVVDKAFLDLRKFPSVDRVSGRRYVNGSGVVLGAGSEICGALFDGTAQSYIKPETSVGLKDFVGGGDTFSVVIDFEVKSLGARKVLLGDWDSTGQNESFVLEQQADNTYRCYAVTISPEQVRVVGGTVTIGRHTAVIRFRYTPSGNVSALHFYLDGEKIGLSVKANPLRSGSDFRLGDAGAAAATIEFDGLIGLFAVSSRFITEALAYRLSRDPYQFLIPA